MNKFRFLCILLSLCLLLGLCACGGSTQPAGALSIPEDPFLVSMEYNRLYAVGADGTAVLLRDADINGYTRYDGKVWSVDSEGVVTAIDLSNGKETLRVSTGLPAVYNIYPYDAGMLLQSYSMQTGSGLYLLPDGSDTPVHLFGERYLSDISVVGHTLLYTEYNQEARLRAYDLDAALDLWDIRIDVDSRLYHIGDKVYIYYPDTASLFEIGPQDGSRRPVVLSQLETVNTLYAEWDGAFLGEGDWSEGYPIYLISADSRQQIALADPDSYVLFVDAAGGRVLLRYVTYEESPDVPSTWYTRELYQVVDMKTGEVTAPKVTGAYAKLFENGDFPVMDSSTARRPVTSAVYSFFCENTGAGGNVPLCSKTHQAWLNIADGVADVALLAAPTQEEQDYLAERNVEIESKLYGGDGLVFIGNNACGVSDLTLDQVRAIYRGEITNWKELGGTDHPIRVLYRDDQSGSQRLFESLLWGGEEHPDPASLGFERLDEMSTIVYECLYEPYSIGYSIMTYLNDVYSSEDLLCFSLEGVSATPENVAAQAYPLSTRGYVVIRADEPEDSPARRLYDWFGSPLSDCILRLSGVTPLHG